MSSNDSTSTTAAAGPAFSEGLGLSPERAAFEHWLMSTSDRDQAMIDLYTRDGLSMGKVAAELGCSLGWVSRRLAQLGVQARSGAGGPRNTERDRQIAQDYIDGATAKAIGEQRGISHSRVLEILAAQGVPRRLSASARSKAEAAKVAKVKRETPKPQGPQIIPAGVKVTICPAGKDQRFTPTGSEPFFSRGAVLPPSPWVQAITGGRP